MMREAAAAARNAVPAMTATADAAATAPPSTKLTFEPATRDAAIDRLNRGLEETDVRGVVTNIPFLSALVTHPKVRANAIDTGFIERELKNLTPDAPPPGDLELCAAVAAILEDEQKAARAETHSPWRISGWMPVGRRHRIFSFRHGQGGEHKAALP